MKVLRRRAFNDKYLPWNLFCRPCRSYRNFLQHLQNFFLWCPLVECWVSLSTTSMHPCILSAQRACANRLSWWPRGPVQNIPSMERSKTSTKWIYNLYRKNVGSTKPRQFLILPWWSLNKVGVKVLERRLFNNKYLCAGKTFCRPWYNVQKGFITSREMFSALKHLCRPCKSYKKDLQHLQKCFVRWTHSIDPLEVQKGSIASTKIHFAKAPCWKMGFFSPSLASRLSYCPHDVHAPSTANWVSWWPRASIEIICLEGAQEKSV